MPSPERTTAPAVSVVVCAYTQARSEALATAVASLAAQSLAPAEVIVAVDHNPALLEWVRRRFPDVVVAENRERRGLPGTRNSGLRAARGDIVAFLDDDAIAAVDWIERLCAAYRDARVVGVGGAVLADWESGPPRWFPEEFHWVVGCSYRGLPTQRSAVRNLIGCNMSFRREAFDQVGGFSSGLGRVGRRPLGCEETELCIRIGAHNPDHDLLYDPDAAVHHRVPAERASWRYFVNRCFSEGLSKAEVARRSGSERALSSERAHAARTLPAGVRRELAQGRFGRAAAIVIGLVVTAAGYLAGRAAPQVGTT